MSSALEFRHVAIRFPIEAGTQGLRDVVPNLPDLDRGFGCDGSRYLVFVENGASNCFDSRNRVARDWMIAAAGSHFDCMSHVCRVAAQDVLGGMVCLRTRAHWTRPEHYIETYRHVLDAAVPIDDARWLLPAAAAFTIRAGALEDARANAGTLEGAYYAYLHNACRLRDQSSWSEFETLPLNTAGGMADWFWLTTCSSRRAPYPISIAPSSRSSISRLLDALCERQRNTRRDRAAG